MSTDTRFLKSIMFVNSLSDYRKREINLQENSVETNRVGIDLADHSGLMALLRYSRLLTKSHGLTVNHKNHDFPKI